MESMLSPRTKSAASPTQLRRSRSRSKPSCRSIAAPPMAPAKPVERGADRLPEARHHLRAPCVGRQFLEHGRAAGAEQRAEPAGAARGQLGVDVDREARPVRQERAGDGRQPVERDQCLERLRLLGVGLGRQLHHPPRVDVEVGEAVALEVLDRVLVRLVLGQAVALQRVDRAPELRLVAEQHEVVDKRVREVLGHRVLDARVRPAPRRHALPLAGIVDRFLCRLAIGDGDRTGDARLLVLVEPGAHPHSSPVAQPRLDVAVVVEVLGLVEQLAELRLRVIGPQDLAGGPERVRPQLALRPHRRLDVEERAARDGGSRVGVRCASAATAGGQEYGEQKGGERGETRHGSFRFEDDATCLPRGPTQGAARLDTPQVGVQIARMQRALRLAREVGAIATSQEIPANRHVRGPQDDLIQVVWDKRR